MTLYVDPLGWIVIGAAAGGALLGWFARHSGVLALLLFFGAVGAAGSGYYWQAEPWLYGGGAALIGAICGLAVGVLGPLLAPVAALYAVALLVPRTMLLHPPSGFRIGEPPKLEASSFGDNKAAEARGVAMKILKPLIVSLAVTPEAALAGPKGPLSTVPILAEVMNDSLAPGSLRRLLDGRMQPPFRLRVEVFGPNGASLLREVRDLPDGYSAGAVDRWTVD
jgi:hypothetical protein